MAMKTEVRDLFERRFKGRGLTLPMLEFATASLARRAGLSDSEMEQRLKLAKNGGPSMGGGR